MLLGAAGKGRLLFLRRGLWGGTGGYHNSPLWFGAAQAAGMDLLCPGLLVCLQQRLYTRLLAAGYDTGAILQGVKAVGACCPEVSQTEGVCLMLSWIS